MSAWGEVAGGLLGGAFSLGGAAMQNAANDRQARKAFKRELWMYQNRYQMTMKDMALAGLNPILAYQQGAGSTPNVSPGAPMQNMLEGFADSARGMNQRMLDAKTKIASLGILENQKEQSFHAVTKTAAEASEAEEAAVLNRELSLKAQRDAEVAAATARNIDADTELKRLRKTFGEKEAELYETPVHFLRWLNDMILGERGRSAAKETSEGLSRGWRWMMESEPWIDKVERRVKEWRKGK